MAALLILELCEVLGCSLTESNSAAFAGAAAVDLGALKILRRLTLVTWPMAALGRALVRHYLG